MPKNGVFRLVRLVCCATLLGTVLVPAWAGSYTLTDGREINGEATSIKDDGVTFKTGAASYSPKITWDKFSQDDLKTLLTEARGNSEKALVESMILDSASTSSKAAAPKESNVEIKPIVTPSRPTSGVGLSALFSSPLGFVIFLLVYTATVFAGYEVAIYRNRPIPVVCGLAAIPFFGIFSSLVFAIMKGVPLEASDSGGDDDGVPSVNPLAVDATKRSALSKFSFGPASKATEVPTGQTDEQTDPNLPAPIVFKRGDFTFNRRFFETKLAGFLRIVPSEEEKDMVVWIKAVRGEFAGNRIIQITADDLHLQVFKANATADEIIPFVEVLEVQIRHKDLV